MASLPSAASKTHLDSGSDDPAQARSEIATLVDKHNDTRAYLSGLLGTDGVAATAKSTLGLTSPASHDYASQGEAEAGAVQNKVMNPLRTAQAIAALASAVNIQNFASSGTWTKPSQGTMALIQLWGAGASGGKGTAGTAQGGGGGGGYSEIWVPLADLGSSETVTIGAGGPAQTTNSTPGTAGGNSTFGSHLTAYGGGTNGNAGGGGGGGLRSAGSNGVTTTGGTGGSPSGGAANSDSLFGGGGGGSENTAAGGSIYGGGGGGGRAPNPGAAGGYSFYGGGGGGGGAGSNGTGNGGAGGVSVMGGNGGQGGDGNGSNGSDGQQPGGGGGGSEAGNSGAGGAGYCRVIVV